ncbi:hypothetical protein BO71DRAFT_153062 [Aspergillus ellipticus CBS 707.79]|uniref:Uncharacterized protein n=1 Tax=Aspergillus ellipticus CBS 707.79 TaxID=1448320 RepID=A0A319D0A4_9EURO|nr:hypothetical protein BO71DRAFT_153062 [Aspergillus ellipticus CBS 707.79]
MRQEGCGGVSRSFSTPGRQPAGKHGVIMFQDVKIPGAFCLAIRFGNCMPSARKQPTLEDSGCPGGEATGDLLACDLGHYSITMRSRKEGPGGKRPSPSSSAGQPGIGRAQKNPGNRDREVGRMGVCDGGLAPFHLPPPPPLASPSFSASFLSFLFFFSI